MANEWGGLELTCQAPQYIPYGDTYSDDRYRAFTVIGSSGAIISGDDYIKAQHNHSRSHIWRNFGILVAFWIFFATLTAIGFERADSSGGSSRLLFKRQEGIRSTRRANFTDEEKTHSAVAHVSLQRGPPAEDVAGSSRQVTFTWKDLDYHVRFGGGEKQLLRNICGFVKPGHLLALMGTSGAGKTTLMDVLAQRKDAGRIEGSIHVDGMPQDISFQRSTGYCEQNDIHEQTATVREALLFSARLRQDYNIPDSEKIDYVDNIIDLLELRDIQNALVGVPGAGLSIEQKKRLTLGVELVAKPKLLFLDEPTSSLDGQSAYNIVRFMRKLAENGQAIICTIHQPSAALFNAFDSLLLLAKGGNTTYSGETGAESTKLLEYFARNGAPCAADVNPAEHIIDVVQGRKDSEKDWVEIWMESPERKEALDELNHLDETAGSQITARTVSDRGKPLHSFASPLWHQMRTVMGRQSIALWRNPNYLWNKIFLHVVNALFSGFTYWKVGNSTFDLQLRLFFVFNFVIIAPAVINQMQPLYLRNRDIFETREKKVCKSDWFICSNTYIFHSRKCTTGLLLSSANASPRSHGSSSVAPSTLSARTSLLASLFKLRYPANSTFR